MDTLYAEYTGAESTRDKAFAKAVSYLKSLNFKIKEKPTSTLLNYSKTPSKSLEMFRVRTKLSLENLSEKLNIQSKYVSEMEEGTRPISRIVALKLGKIFNTDHRRFL